MTDVVQPKVLENVVIGVDLDGVCADFYGFMRQIAAEWLEVSPDTLPSEVSYGLGEWGINTPEQYQSLHRFAVTQRGLFENVPMIPGARRYLRKLSDEGARVRIITHRLFIHYFHQSAVSQTIEWLDTNGIPYWDLCFMKEKQQVGANVYVEDAPSNVDKLRSQDLDTVCFANSTNGNVADPRLKTWESVYEYIKSKYAGK